MPPKQREFLAGDLVFAKIKGYLPWPARIKGPKSCQARYQVTFFGSYDKAVVASKDLYPYEQYKHKLGIQRKSKKFNKALHEIATTPNMKFPDETDSETSFHASVEDKPEEEDTSESSGQKRNIAARAAEDSELDYEGEVDVSNVKLLKKKTYELAKADSTVFEINNGAKTLSKMITTYKPVKNYSDDSSGDNYVLTTPESDDSSDKDSKELNLSPLRDSKPFGYKAKTSRPIPAPEDDSDSSDRTRNRRKGRKRDTSMDSDSEPRSLTKKHKKTKKSVPKTSRKGSSEDTNSNGEKKENLEEKLKLKSEKLAAKLEKKEKEKERRKREKMEKKRLERLKRAQSKEFKEEKSEESENKDSEEKQERKASEMYMEPIIEDKSIGERLAQIDHAIKNSLSKTGANVDKCLDAMDSIGALNITVTDIATFGTELKELIGTLRKCRKYKQDVRVCIKADENLNRLKQFASTNEEPRRESTETKDEQQVKTDETLDQQNKEDSECTNNRLSSLDENPTSRLLSSSVENSEENVSDQKSETSSHDSESL